MFIHLFDKNRSTTACLEAKVAALHEFHFTVDVFSPKILVLVDGDIKPRFHVSTVMNDGSFVDMIHADAWIISKPKHLPGFIK